MSELLIEIGCEEIPASYIEKGASQLLDLMITQLKEHSLQVGSFQTFCTPRRLILQLKDIPLVQPDKVEKQRGPSLKSAYDQTGEPTPSLIGFCKAQNVEINEIFKEKDYIWCNRRIIGKYTPLLLQDVLVNVLSKIQFPKNMRWGYSKNKFARPIRWILASFDGQLIPFSFEGVDSGLESRGHRFKNPEPFKAISLNELLTELRKRFVEPDPKMRIQKIKDSASKATSYSSVFSGQDELIYENAFLTEWPECLECEFDPSFLNLPKEVLTTTMIKHLRFFPLSTKENTLTNRCLSVMNNGDPQTVKSGNEWVLNARFNDARFFYEEDKNISIDEFLEKTHSIIYQDKLGTVRQKGERLKSLCRFIAEQENFKDLNLAEQAGLYAKSDLATGLVSELPELQGTIAGLYAEREGLSQEVCQALKNQYNLHSLLKNKSTLSLCLAIADQIDKLIGYLSIGILPKGSSDPFALRKAATNLILLNSLRNNRQTSLLPLFEKAKECYADQGFIFDGSYQKHLEELFTSRYKALAYHENRRWSWKEDVNTNHIPLLEAALSDLSYEIKLSPEKILFKLNVLSNIKPYEAFVQAATRCFNIYRSALEKGFDMHLNVSNMESLEAELLYKKINEVQLHIESSLNQGNHNLFIENATKLSNEIHDLFEKNMIIVDDTKVRESRLGLIQHLYKLLINGGDFSKLFDN